MIGSTILERTEHPGWEPHVFLQTPFSERAGKLSPDGAFCRILFGRIGLRRSLCTTLSRGRPQGDGVEQRRDKNALEPGRQRAVLCRGADLGGRFGIERFQLFGRLGDPPVRASRLEARNQLSPLRRLGRRAAVHLGRACGRGRGRPQAVDPRGPELVRRIPRPPAGLSPTKRTT